MASTSLRNVARHFKLRFETSISQNRPTYITQYRCMSIHSAKIQQIIAFKYASPHHGSVVNPQCSSKPSVQCTPQSTYPISAVQIRSISNRSIAATRKNPSTISFQQRFLSSRPPNEDNKTNAGPLSTPKVAAPSILKKALASTPHENIYTIPNILTFSRLLAAPAIGYFILNAQPVTALALFAYAGFTDLIDGFLARRFNQQTVVGTVIDPMADKTLMTVVVVCLGVQGLIPVWLAVIILGRDVGLAISAIYYRYISLPPPKTFARYWDFSLPSAEVRPTEISKINTLLQLLLVGNAMVLPVLPAAWIEAWNLVGVFEGWQFLVAGTTIWSGLSYVFSKDAVKILRQQEGESKEFDSSREDEKKQ